MDGTSPRVQSNNKHGIDKSIKQLNDQDFAKKLSDYGMSYEKAPLELGLSVRSWIHYKLQNLVVAED